MQGPPSQNTQSCYNFADVIVHIWLAESKIIEGEQITANHKSKPSKMCPPYKKFLLRFAVE